MLNTVFKDAIINREKTLSILKGPEYEKIIQKAKENWIDYTPEKQEVVSAGIDSSFNSRVMGSNSSINKNRWRDNCRPT